MKDSSHNDKRPLARKRFGQHFLHDQAILARMAAVIRLQASDTVVEIGPGRGALTQYLLQHLSQLDVVEIDRDLIEHLQSLGEPGQLQIHQADILNFEITSIRTGQVSDLRVVGNLPYNISTPLMFHLFASISHIKDMYFLLQKEVAERMAATVNSSQYGRLSVMTQFFCDVECLFEVGPEAFIPRPKVDSTFICLNPHQRYNLSSQQFDSLETVVSHVFTMRRKTLRKSLSALVPVERLENVSVDLSLRPQALTVDQFISLSQQLALE